MYRSLPRSGRDDQSHPGSLGTAIRDVLSRAASTGDTASLYKLARSIPYWAERLGLTDQGQLDADWRLVEGPDTDELREVIRQYHHLLTTPGQTSRSRAAAFLLYAAARPELNDIVSEAEAVTDGPWLRSTWETPTSSTISPVVTKSLRATGEYSEFSILDNGEQVLALSTSGAVSVHDLRTLEIRTLQTYHGDKVGSLAVTPDGQWLGVLSDKKIQFCWPTQDRYSSAPFEGSSPLCIAISSDGSRCAIAGNNDVNFYDADGNEVKVRRRRSRLVADSVLGRGDKVARSTGSMPWIRNSVLVGFLLYIIGVSENWTVFSVVTVMVGSLALAILRGNAIVRRRRNLSDIGGFFSSICLSPDASTLASADVPGRIQIWSVRHGNLLRTIPREIESQQSALMFDPSGKILAVADNYGALWVWDIVSQRELPLNDPLQKEVLYRSSISWSPEGDFVAYAKGRFVGLWELARNPADGSLQAVRRAALSLSSAAETVRFVDAGSHIAVVSGATSSVRFWERESLFREQATSDAHRVRDICFSPDGTWLALAAESGQPLTRETSGKVRAYLPASAHTLARVAIAPDGTWLAGGTPDGKVGLWEPSGRQIAVLDHEDAPDGIRAISSLQISPTGLIIAGCTDQYVRIWDMTGRFKGQVHAGEPGENQPAKIADRLSGSCCVCVIDGGRAFAVAGLDDKVRTFNSSTFQLLQRVYPYGSGREGPEDERITSLSASPDGHLLAAGRSNGQVSCWRHTETTLHSRFLAHDYSVSDMAFSPRGNLLASVDSNTIRIWDVERRVCIASVPFEGAWHCDWSPDGRQIACSGANGAFLFNLRGMDRIAHASAVLQSD